MAASKSVLGSCPASILVPGGRAGLQRTLFCFVDSVELGGLGRIRQETARMGKEIAGGR